MDIRLIQPTAHHQRRWRTLRALRRRIRLERGPLDLPGRGLAHAYQQPRKQHRLEVLRSQVR